MSHALIVGKFYPPHMGHHYLIETALDECDDVTVLVLWSERENLNPLLRVAWLKETHPDACVLQAQDEYEVDYNSDEAWLNHLEVMDRALHIERRPTVTHVYSSERYGERLAAEFRAEHRTVDLDRTAYSVSGSAMRADIRGNWDYLAPAARQDLCFRVIVCGAESSGTTTLAKQLADHYKTVCVPEYGRHYDWAVGKHHTWTAQDFYHIAREQRRWEESFARRSENGILICDTDTYATAMFSEVYLGEQCDGIIENIKRPGDLYLITDHVGVDFEDDGTRYNSGKRDWMTAWLKDTIRVPHYTMWGDQDRRLRESIAIIDESIRDCWKYNDPIEYAEA